MIVGWYSVYTAIIQGYDVRAALKGEINPKRALFVAIQHIDEQVATGSLRLNRVAQQRVEYWRKEAKP